MTPLELSHAISAALAAAVSLGAWVWLNQAEPAVDWHGTINGVSFSIDEPEKYQNDARIEAVKDAAAKAELYAQAVGYKVKRIVTISEQDYYPQPVPMMAMRMQDAGGAPETPIAAGEVSLEQTVSIVFELTK